MNDSVHSVTRDLRKCSSELDNDAALRLYGHFHSYLLGVVRRHRTDPRLVSRIDSGAVVNSAMNVFLRLLAESEKLSEAKRMDAARMLVRICLRALNDELKRERSEKRDYRLSTVTDGGGEIDWDSLADERALEPSEIAIALERESELATEVAEVLTSVHPLAKKVLELSLDGHTNREIADVIGLGMRSVQLIKKSMQTAWERHCDHTLQ